MADLSHLTAVLIRKFDISSLTLLSVDMFEDKNDQAIFAKLSEKYGTDLLKMLKEKLVAHESNNLSHLTAVLTRKFDISSLTSLSVGMFDDENDRAIFTNLSEKHGTELLKMLKDKRAQQLAGRKGRDGFGNLVDSGNLVHISMMTRCYGCSALKELASLMVCGGCRVNKYCSRDCQVAHWREHSKS